MSVKLQIFSYSSVLTYVLGAQKNCLIEMPCVGLLSVIVAFPGHNH